jgi:hypothetical protein
LKAVTKIAQYLLTYEGGEQQYISHQKLQIKEEIACLYSPTKLEIRAK